MNLQHLRYFKLACAYQNISKAAQKLNIAQSSLSLAIKSLESEFGICLIKRQRVGFVLTPEGERFLALTEGLLDHADRVVTLMTDESNQHNDRRNSASCSGCSVACCFCKKIGCEHNLPLSKLILLLYTK